MARLKRDKGTAAREESLAALTGGAKSKGGRPKGGKREDPDWVARSFFLQTATDNGIEDLVILSKRAGTLIDKSDVANTVLSAYVKFRIDGNTETFLESIASIQSAHK
jgi:hypothetical protein